MCILCEQSDLPPSTVLLDCSGCPKVQLLPAPDSLPNLQYLAIYNTNIDVVPAYPELKGLYMMECPIASLPDLPKLKRLNASGSNLARLPGSLHQLELLSINRTSISTLPEMLISVQMISAAECCQLESISTKLINLESLIVRATGLAAVPALLNLNYIDISNTIISSLPLDQLPCLRKVVARGCTLADPFSMIDRGIDLTS